MLSNKSSALRVRRARCGHQGRRVSRPRGKLVLVIVMCLAHVTLAPSAVEAWGKKAHRLVAGVAESLLDDHSRRTIRDIVGPGGLVAVANWADEIRDARPDTAPWHYVNIPLSDARYDPLRHCTTPTEGACVVAAIERFTKQLADPAASQGARAEALKFVTHFVADIHQPLHCVAEARGGNDIRVVFFGQRARSVSGDPWSLHAVWDSGLLHRSGLKERAHRARLLELLRVEPLPNRHADSPAGWARESHRLAAEVALNVPPSGRIGPRYARAGMRVIDHQLALAGFRLAEVLRAAFSSETH